MDRYCGLPPQRDVLVSLALTRHILTFDHGLADRQHRFARQCYRLRHLVAVKQYVYRRRLNPRSMQALQITVRIVTGIMVTRKPAMIFADFAVCQPKIIPGICSDIHGTLLETQAFSRIFAVYHLEL